MNNNRLILNNIIKNNHYNLLKNKSFINKPLISAVSNEIIQQHLHINRNDRTSKLKSFYSTPIAWSLNRFNHGENSNQLLLSPNTHIGNVRFIRMQSKSLISNVMRSLVTTGIGFASLALYSLSFTVDFIMSTVGPIGAILIGRLIWKLYNYRKLYNQLMIDVQKHRDKIQQVTRAPFQLPSIQECDFDKKKVVHSDGTKETLFKCVFNVPDNVANGHPATVEVLAFKSPFNLIESKKKNKPFKKDLVISAINLYTAYGKSFVVYEAPTQLVESYVNRTASKNMPVANDSSYYDTKDIKEADIINEKNFDIKNKNKKN
ncbi:hypothetical protein PPL_05843 [Heterostelium album PN500]|uniref:Uncharacterized protein n=1 Tax=Heterostelium pallidum (strain ATCC 26659 / Pp 5 / PN500) TaxID=670386 RepID=D3BBH5_HETP5|nr:hypothetical protein PPL_05843 [Heterostelium album PN500]EFA81008.1 hypothetical protein PPL_05843 [Heterostelium album PN500]|eukprot:XP_020433126.1 hypothetical protein PPL_05843 [Heterostelium album PN500]